MSNIFQKRRVSPYGGIPDFYNKRKSIGKEFNKELPV